MYSFKRFTIILSKGIPRDLRESISISIRKKRSGKGYFHYGIRESRNLRGNSSELYYRRLLKVVLILEAVEGSVSTTGISLIAGVNLFFTKVFNFNRATIGTSRGVVRGPDQSSVCRVEQDLIFSKPRATKDHAVVSEVRNKKRSK